MSLGPGCGLLVVGHGTADPTGAAETRAVAAAVAEAVPGMAVELGFLEVIGPTVAEALGRLAARGCREVVAAPLLLFAAGHAKRDVPEAIATAAAALRITVCQADPLGLHPALVALSRRRRHEAVAGLEQVAAEATLLLVVGRGSSDPEALPQLRRFAEATLVDAAAPRASRVRFGFAAAARPTLAEAIAAAADPALAGLRRIVVQPHLLFHGHVEEQVTEAVGRGRALRPDLEWIQAGRLGADPAVVTALLARAGVPDSPGESLSRQGSDESSQ